MPAYVCLLRGVNVTGYRRVDMKELKGLFAALGHTDVTTYIQSGNVVFRAPKQAPDGLARAIEKRIADDLGVNPVALIRTARELAAVVEANPYLGKGADAGKLHVTFLAATPDTGRLDAVDAGAFMPDEFVVRGREVYLHCPNGYGRTKLNNAFWEKRAGVAATTRNWKTVRKLLELAGGAPAPKAAG